MGETYVVVARDHAGAVVNTKTFTTAQMSGLSAIGLLRQLVAEDRPVIESGGSVTIALDH